jgi:hypothetical protein
MTEGWGSSATGRAVLTWKAAMLTTVPPTPALAVLTWDCLPAACFGGDGTAD